MSGQRTDRLLRIPRTDTDNANDFILLHTSSSSTSSSPLDSYLLATEGEAAYGRSIKNSSVHKFLHKAFTGTHDDFQIILSSLLLKMPVRSEDKLLLDGIEISATAADATVTLTIRKSVEGIKQRIAAIGIPQTEDEISLYDWCGEACIARDEIETELRGKEERANELEKGVQKLVSQLRDLTILKKQHEDAMLVKFQELLNSKKQHIRDLTRIVNAGGRGGEPIGSSGGVSMSKTDKLRKRSAAVTDEEGSDGGFAMAGKNGEVDDTDSGDESDSRSTEHTSEVEIPGSEDSQHTPREIKKPPITRGKGKGKAKTTSVSRKKVAKPPARNTGRPKRAATGRTTAATARKNKTSKSLEREADEPEVEIARPQEPSRESPPAKASLDSPECVTDDDEL